MEDCQDQSRCFWFQTKKSAAARRGRARRRWHANLLAFWYSNLLQDCVVLLRLRAKALVNMRSPSKALLRTQDLIQAKVTALFSNSLARSRSSQSSTIC